MFYRMMQIKVVYHCLVDRVCVVSVTNYIILDIE